MEILFLDSIDSTNKYAKEHIANIADKTVVVASAQTNGKGRLNRKWTDVGGENIYASIVLKPSSTYKDVYSNLTQYLALVIATIMEENYNVQASIKWPNDIKVNGKKISGILAEGVINNNKLDGIVLGVGINLNCNKDVFNDINQPATALNIEIKQHVDKDIFLNKLLEKFFLEYDRFIDVGFPLIREQYIERCNFIAKPITVDVLGKRLEGIATDITENGALRIVDNSKKEQILYMGDIL